MTRAAGLVLGVTALALLATAERFVVRTTAQTTPVPAFTVDPRWPALFADERDAIATALAPWLVGVPEHIGSTAVPGLAAKPIVDMLLEVRSMEDVVQHIAPILKREGYEFFWRDRERGLPGIAYA